MVCPRQQHNHTDDARECETHQLISKSRYYVCHSSDFVLHFPECVGPNGGQQGGGGYDEICGGGWFEFLCEEQGDADSGATCLVQLKPWPCLKTGTAPSSASSSAYCSLSQQLKGPRSVFNCTPSMTFVSTPLLEPPHPFPPPPLFPVPLTQARSSHSSFQANGLNCFQKPLPPFVPLCSSKYQPPACTFMRGS